MEWSFLREDMLVSLQRIIGAAEKRLTTPILGQVLIQALGEDKAQLDTTDNELAWRSFTVGKIDPEFRCTVSARKFLDVVKAVPPDTEIHARLERERLILRFKSSRFVLSTLPADTFPKWQASEITQWIAVPQNLLRRQLEATMFSMSQQDIRYYLQGLLLVAEQQFFGTVTTDGHRLSISRAELAESIPETMQSILPRKTITELRRNLLDSEEIVRMGFAEGQMIFEFGNDRLITKLIEGRFPDYNRVVPRGHPNCLIADREHLREILQRVAIVAADKLPGVRFILESDQECKVTSHNTENEEAEEILYEYEYRGEPIEVGFNLHYLQDVLNAITADKVKFEMLDGDASILITAEPEENGRYVVMPMRL